MVVAGAPGGAVLVTPIDAAVTVDGPAPVDTLVLGVPGGHLSWSLLSGQRIPTATLDDADEAQDWLWAVYGEAAALAVATFAGPVGTGRPDRRAAEPGQAVAVVAAAVLPQTVVSARRLAYAHWASRWWPASTVDGITPLDEGLLALDIAALTVECDLLADGADAELPTTAVESPRQSDYALAAGPQSTSATSVLARGTSGWDWRNCPPGLIDASERAVTWEVHREAGRILASVRAVAAPQLRGPVPAHLRPYAHLRTAAGTHTAALTLTGDDWIGSVAIPGMESITAVDISVPGVGYGSDSPTEAATREQIRRFARKRLHAPDRTDLEPLAAETAAAEEPDF
ncbi:hypothetical protein EBN03_05960 [Nocardia stercoris]|uniref:Uncharacterized protein n=1 Tax=Nocardia stercoris TaxID=2483361 RepID=A0A3M2LCG3_9NOCA|nr:hypothetical protein EBN03_05960 [Nocardia stercoris]